MRQEEMIERVVRLSGPVPDESAYRRYLAQLQPEILQHKMVILDLEENQVKNGNLKMRLRKLKEFRR